MTRKRKLLLALVALMLLGGLGAGALTVKLGPRRVLKALRKRVRAVSVRLATTERCVDGPGALTTCVASELAKLPNHGPVPHEAWLFDADRGAVTLHAARNETVAFQVVLKGNGVSPPLKARLVLSDLQGPGATIKAAVHSARFLEHYVWVEPGGYTWGAPSQVLPWPEFYPDALIPFTTRCGSGAVAAGRTNVDTFDVPPRDGASQAVWVELYVPSQTAPGQYRGAVTVSAGGASLKLPLELKVHRASLPDRPTVHAVGELYAPYKAEGVGQDVSKPAWQRMAHCYQQLAHRHRAVFVERMGDIKGLDELHEDPPPGAWLPYDEAFGPALTGALFTPARGYTSGPGRGVPVAAWRTPWAQPFNGRLKGPLSAEEIEKYRRLARVFAAHAAAKKWDQSYFFAYIFDEVEGGIDVDSDEQRGQRKEQDSEVYLRLAHGQMRRVQQALDQGAGGRKIHLMWTSHANPTAWSGREGVDLAGTIRLWVPNAAAADVGFLAGRARAGEQIWFYHHGHPSVGLHAINAPGAEMRTWGAIAARYGFGGMFMWAVNLSDTVEPYRKPSYKRDDDRFGNGTLVYPGAKLTTIGWPALNEPVPSIRLKLWRRGLQDAELATLARKAGHADEVQRQLKALIPRALSEGRGDAAWSVEPEVWFRARLKLLKLASRE